MNEGLSDHIEFLGPDGAHRNGALTPTDIKFGVHTVDSEWLIWEAHAPRTQIEKIYYFAHDRSVWWAKVHCHWDHINHNGKQHIGTWFEHERDNGQDNHDDPNIGFLDWEGNRWIATIQTAVSPFPVAPHFLLKRAS